MKNRLLPIIFTILIAVLAFGSCKKHKTNEENANVVQEPMVEIKGDSMIYGLACDGSTDSVIVIWPFNGEPITYNCIDAKQSGRIIGQPQIGDWIGVMADPQDKAAVTMVINLDQLKATWTYPVLPVFKDIQHMSKRMQKRMIANMPDSIKQTYLVPREYGFTLKRGHQAVSVGHIFRSNTLEDDSPVQYPAVKNYKQWHMLNGRLILVSGERMALTQHDGVKSKMPENTLDTLDFEYMDEDSLILRYHGMRIGFHKKENALKANAAATKAQAEQDKKKEQQEKK